MPYISIPPRFSFDGVVDDVLTLFKTRIGFEVKNWLEVLVMSTVPLSFAMRRPSLSGKKRVLSAVGSTTERVVSNALFVAPSKLIVWSSSICRFPSRLKLPLISLSWPLMTTFLPAWSTRSAYVTLEILTASE